MDEKDEKRFSASYVQQNDCWIWVRGCFRGGYGAFSVNGKAKRAHRVAYELFHGLTFSSNQFLHHRCGNKSCVNPFHLEITNQIDHVDSAIYGNKEKTHCPHGHEYTPENICWSRGGKSRECRTCKYQRMRRRYHRKKQQFASRLKELALKCQSS